MGLASWIRMSFDRIETNFKAVYSSHKDESLVEYDPVGDFLNKKQAGMLNLEDDEVWAETAVEPDPGEVGVSAGEIEESQPVVVNLQQDPDEVETTADEKETLLKEGAEQLQQVDDEMIMEDSTAIDIEGSNELDAEKVVEEVAEEAENEIQMLETDSEEGEEADTPEKEGFKTVELKAPPVEETEGDGELDSLLEVFKSEPIIDNPISILSKELEDVNVGSLLEESRRIADNVKKRR